MSSIQDWTPQEHVDRACELLQQIADEQSKGSELLLIQMAQAQADVHCNVAEAKMHLADFKDKT